MSQYTREFCERYTDRLMAADEPERLRLIWAMADTVVQEEEAGFIIVVGLVLRDRRHYDWAEYVFQVATGIPQARHSALFELSIIHTHQGRLDRAVELLRRADELQPLNPYQHRALAHVLGCMGDLKEAAKHLEISIREDPGSFEECLALRQLSEYVQAFPAEDAVARARALQTLLPNRTAAEVADQIVAALEAGRPYSLVRVNDGEGAFLHLSVEDEARFAALYRRNRREWHRIIFGDERLLVDPYFLSAAREFTDNLHEADCIGADQSWGLGGEYAWGSIRNIPSLFNIVRKFEQMAATGQLAGRSTTLCSPQINEQLLFGGHLERIIATQSRVGLISTHQKLPQALTDKFGLSEVVYHRTPGEQSTVPVQDRTPLPEWHGRICDELEHVRPGTLYLVAAGLMSKIYCQRIRAKGGVGLDIGAVADIWVKNPSRAHHVDPGVQAFNLTGS